MLQRQFYRSRCERKGDATHFYSGLILKMHLSAQLPAASRQSPALLGACDWPLATGNWPLATGGWRLATRFV
jgi:hypothetical protein